MRKKYIILLSCFLFIIIGFFIVSGLNYKNYSKSFEKEISQSVNEPNEISEILNQEENESMANPRVKIRNATGDEVIGLDHKGNILAVGNITSEKYGFFQYLGSKVSQITMGWFSNLNVSSTANSSEFYQAGNLVIDTASEFYYNHTLSTFNAWDNRWTDTYNATYAGYSGGVTSWNRSGTDVFLHHTGDRVGIGTTSPDHELEVEGAGAAIQLSSANNPMALLANAGGGAALEQGIFQLYDTGSVVVQFIANAGDSYINTGGNVGIGTGSPATALHVEDVPTAYRGQLSLTGTTTTDAYLTLYNGSTYGGYLLWDASEHDLILQNYNAGSYGDLALNPSGGNVGIGTASPGRKLDVRGAGVNDGGFVSVANSDASDYLVFYSGRSLDQYSRVYWDVGLTGFEFGTTTTQAGACWASKLIIKSTGEVGIGTTSPVANYKLTLQQAGTGTDYLYGRQDDGSTIAFSLRADASDNVIFGLYNGAGTEKVSLSTVGDSFFMGGNVGIGTSSPQNKLDVEHDNYNIARFLRTGEGGFSINSNLVQTYLSVIGAQDFFIETYDGGWETRLYINNTGNIGIGTVTPSRELDVHGDISFSGTGTSSTGNLNYFTSGSDFVLQRASSSRLFKENIKNISTEYTNKLLELSPKIYQRKDTKQFETGLIAEEVELINPDWVVYDYLDYNVSQEKIAFSVKYQDIAVATLKLVQEQQNQIDFQQTQINEMKQALCNLNQTQFCPEIIK